MNTLEEIICQQGIQKVSIRLIAEKTGLTQGFIYRHFGDVQELLTMYARDCQAFPNFVAHYLDQLSCLELRLDVAQIWSTQIILFFRQMRTSKASREISKISLVGNDSLADAICQTQHKDAINRIKQLALLEGADNSAIMAILLGGMHYLTLMAHHNRHMIDIDLRSETGWLRIEIAMKTILQKINKSVDSPRLKPNPAATAV